VTSTVTPFTHLALFYRGRDEYVAGAVEFVREGVAAGEPVAIAVPGENLVLLKAALGPDAEKITFLDMTEAGRNPGRILPHVLLDFANRHDGPVRIIGEPIWPDRSEDEYPACAQHEALINHAFAGREAKILCPYDLAGLSSTALRDAERTHPVLVDVGGSRESDIYAPDDVVARYNEPLARPESAAVLRFTVRDLSSARRFVLEQAGSLGLDGDRCDDLALAAAELCANSIVHGEGGGILAVWHDGGHLVCEVSDQGRIADPLAGRIPATPHQLGGRGLLMVNYLADLVRTHTGEEGTTVRAYVRA
jgi:anti-sigma regulatory factor (Ser/Thr protein kinase)